MRTLIGALLLATALAACTSQVNYKGGPLPGPAQDLISDRPQNQDRVIAIVKLSSPPLLSTIETDSKGQRRVKLEAKQALENEQQSFLQDLARISPDIKVIYRYQMALNGFALVIPSSVRDQIPNLPHVRNVQASNQFAQPEAIQGRKILADENLAQFNSVKFIEADQVWKNLKVKNSQGEEIPVDGRGMRVGIIDTGVDYTHKMLGGPGTPEAFRSVDPVKPNSLFPNSKVVGGIDLVGSKFDAGGDSIESIIPIPDGNPIDEAGHGTHVAGTVAGLGDYTNTYDGVAPKADIYAIKVFGAGGSTSDTAVVAAFDYAADPNGDGILNDQLDVINLSLGGSYGQAQTLYREAVNNLTRGGTVVVASAGNSGAEDFIVGSPSTSDEALSVAASVDNMPKNWSFRAVEFSSSTNPKLMARAIEGPISKPIKNAGDVKGELVYIGVGDKALPPDVSEKLRGRVALIDRGVVPFLQKLQLAFSAGAIGAVVANNQDGAPIQMGGEGTVQFPAIMITKGLADTIKADLAKGPVTVDFFTEELIQQPELIDTITDFSSKGPRSQDALIKPEISAPGLEIISAAMGSGFEGVEMSGTSMSGPHMTGVMTLLKQYRSQLSARELKSLVITTATSMDDASQKLYPISRQGAGRVRTYRAATSPIVIDQPTLSLGHVQLNTGKVIQKQIEVKNISDQPVAFEINAETHPNLKLEAVSAQFIPAGQSRRISLNFVVMAPQEEKLYVELDGFVFFKFRGEEVARLPVLALATRLSAVVAKDLIVRSASALDAPGAVAELALENISAQVGYAYLFNLIGQDARKPIGGVPDSFRTRDCDLQAAGYRVIEKSLQGKLEKVLQVGVKLYQPMTTWHYCEISVQIDSNGDELADQELGGLHTAGLAGVDANVFASVLLDAVKVREIRKRYETELASGKQASLSYRPAVIDVQPMLAYPQSSVAIIETKLSALNLRPDGQLAIKVASLHGDSDAIEGDDFLDRQLTEWKLVDPNQEGAGFFGMPELIKISASQTERVSLQKGQGSESLLLLMPFNRLSQSPGSSDEQAKVIEPSYQLMGIN